MAQSMFDLSGRMALVTGSSQGIGEAIATGLAEAGARLVLNGRDGAKLEVAAERLRAAGREVSTAAFDVTDQAAVREAVARIEAETGPIDILVNNAGMQFRSPLEEFPAERWAEIVRTNLDSVFFVGQTVAKGMIGRGRGKIINICSLASEAARSSIAPYAATKGAVKLLTKGMCSDWARHGLHVNGIGPGYFKTPLNTALIEDAEFDAWVRRRTPAGRWGELEELQGAAVFLAAPASDFVNGHILYVDGGLLATI